jgi:peptidoglycan hydrolase CwlO-like protein
MNTKMLTPPLIKRHVTRLLLVLVACVMAFSVPGQVSADTFDDQIRQIQSEVQGHQAEAARLRAEANTLQNALNVLTAQKNAIQAQVNLSQARYDQLVADIELSEQKLAKQQDVLAATISDLSEETSTSPIELLAGSYSIGDFIDRQEYRSSVQEQIQSSIKEIKALKIKLAKQKKEVELVLADQKKQRDLLAVKEAEQSGLLAATQGQEAAYQGIIAEKNNQVASLRAQQAASMRSSNGAENIVYGSSSYPWMGSTMAYNDYCQYYSGGSAADPWGYCKRQCVSYVAWKLNTDGRGNRGYSGLGNANQWGAGGAPVGIYNIQPGDVIIWYVGGYGHVMYVESVNGSNVHISQMNVPYDSGSYSEANYSFATLSNGSYEVRRFH